MSMVMSRTEHAVCKASMKDVIHPCSPQHRTHSVRKVGHNEGFGQERKFVKLAGAAGVELP
jgi:hypothetical protein